MPEQNSRSKRWNRDSIRQRTSRTRRARAVLCALVASTGITAAIGCNQFRKLPDGPHDTKLSYHDNYGLRIEYPQVSKCATPQSAAAEAASPPLALQDPSQLPVQEISLDEAIQIAVQQSPVLRSIGGTLVSAGVQFGGAATKFDPALAASNPFQSTEAALAAFDAQLAQQLLWLNVDRPVNQVIPGFTVPVARQNNAQYNFELAKRTALGSRFALRHVVNYNKTNNPGVTFPSTFEGWFEAEWRQPLLQGAGVTYNRIAGPNAAPGQYNGVLIARLNEDVALTDFEASLIQLVVDVEQAYWDLVTAYRVIDTAVRGREAALQTFQYQQVRLEVGTGRRDEEAQARSQFYQFQAQVETSLAGPTGLYAIEQRLRYLIGLPASDGRILKPSTNPTDAKVVFDWDSALGQSLNRRVEIRKQMLNVKRRELELIAAKHNLQPRLDFLAVGRARGLGDKLIGSTTGGPLDNMYGTIAGGKYQEFQAGFEFNMPVGLRVASLAVTNAKLNLRRERALLAEAELRISHDLAQAARQIELNHQLMDTNYNRYLADLNQVEVLLSRYRDGSDNINFLLQAQRQVVISEVEFYRALSGYNLAIRDFHRQKGSLLAYNHVQLAEDAWAACAEQDAYRTGRFLKPRHVTGATEVPAPLTTGPFDPSAVQSSTLPSGAYPEDAVPMQWDPSPADYDVAPGQFDPLDSMLDEDAADRKVIDREL
jgi:outer membrane protein TolC